MRPESKNLHPNSKIRVIFFDAGGTLFRPYPSVGAVYARVARRHGVRVRAAQVERLFHEHWHKRNGMSSLAGRTSQKIERDWWYAMVRDVFGPLATASGAGRGTFRDFDAFFEELYDLFARAECWRLFRDTVPAVKRLRSAGYRLGIISNWDHRLFGIVNQLGLAGLFDHVAASAAVGVAKPHHAIFDAALKAMKVSAGESLHVGDSLEDDYHGALRAGLHAVLLDRKGRTYNGAMRIGNLAELHSVLSGRKHKFVPGLPEPFSRETRRRERACPQRPVSERQRWRSRKGPGPSGKPIAGTSLRCASLTMRCGIARSARLALSPLWASKPGTNLCLRPLSLRPRANAPAKTRRRNSAK